MSPLPDEARRELAEARRLLEHPSFAARLSDVVGRPIENVLKLLPEGAQNTVQLVAQKSLEKVADWAVLTMDDHSGETSRSGMHKWMAAATGAVGGAVGLAGLPVELPISTGIMMRSILDVARANGEDIRQVETRLHAMTVFALGGTSSSDDGAESGYFAARIGLARAVTEAAKHIAGKSTPALIRLITHIAARFSIPVSSKVAAQAVPIVGAIGGATLNTLFIDHFQDMARGHFTVRRLERAYGTEAVKEAWDALS